MSRPLDAAEVVYTQRFLRCAGLYEGRIDALWGPLTDRAYARFGSEAQALADQFGRFDPRTESNLALLHLPAQAAARRFLRRLREHGVDARIISGTRSYAEQNRLFRQGRFGNPGQRVTNARGGHSLHNFGIAWDLGLFEGGTYVTRVEPYDRAAKIGLAPELAWGGHWTSFVDRPHYQLALPLRISGIRQCFESGEPYC